MRLTQIVLDLPNNRSNSDVRQKCSCYTTDASLSYLDIAFVVALPDYRFHAIRCRTMVVLDPSLQSHHFGMYHIEKAAQVARRQHTGKLDAHRDQHEREFYD